MLWWGWIDECRRGKEVMVMLAEILRERLKEILIGSGVAW